MRAATALAHDLTSGLESPFALPAVRPALPRSQPPRASLLSKVQVGRQLLARLSQFYEEDFASAKPSEPLACHAGSMGPGEQKALVIEDDADIRALLVHTLTMQGFEVFDTASGRKGVELATKQLPDVITIDLGLPDLDGIEVCRRIRNFSDAYVVMVTARHEEVDRLMGLETGADDFVSKPFSPRELQARITAMFRRPRSVALVPDLVPTAPLMRNGEAMTHGRLELDAESHIVTVDGAEIRLTRIEFELLATMLGSPKRVWSREILLSKVWGDSWVSDHHVVEVHVGNLRRKLAAGRGKSTFIHTVRGVGYRMETPEAV